MTGALPPHPPTVDTLPRALDEERAARLRLEGRLQLHTFLTRANEALFSVTTPEEAFDTLCRVAIQAGHFRLAWVGRVDPALGELRPVAVDGAEAGCVQQLRVTTDPALLTSHGPVGLALRDQRTVVVHDLARDPRTAPWHPIAAAHGLGSVVACPIPGPGPAHAAFAVYAHAPGFFHPELVALVEEVTRFLGLVLATLEARAQQQAEELRRRKSEASVQTMFAESPLAMGVLDLTTSRILRVNRAFTALFGYTLDDLPTAEAQLAAFFPDPAYRDLVRSTMTEEVAALTREAPSARSSDLTVTGKDGLERYITPFITRVGREVIFAWVDFTDVVRTTRELEAYKAHLEELVAARTRELARAVEEADAANRAKSTFLAMMSHEIRTPLNGVIGMAEILAAADLPERERDAVRTIQQSGRGLLAVIDDILDVSKIEAGHLSFDVGDHDLRPLVEEVCATLTPVAVAKEVDLALFIAPELPARVACDAMRLRQVLYNLVGNAIKFSSGRATRRGHVALRVEAADGGPAHLVVRVADNGIGMTPEVQARLFRAFGQGEASTTRRFGGTGLGLYITHALVERMGGTIAVHSTPEVGSTFTITLPLAPAAPHPAPAAPSIAGVTVLIALPPSPHCDPRDLERLLAHAGARTVRVATLGEAAERAREAGRCVILRPPPPDPHGEDAAVEALPEARQLALFIGEQPQLRLVGPAFVTLALDFLRADRLIEAVAVAAGRASPGVAPRGPEESVRFPLTQRLTRGEALALGRLVLVAEDDSINQKVILRQLELLGFVGDVAGNGAEALRKWRTGQYALLLSDLHMPGMDGYALTRAIRAEEPPGTRLPILALSANALRGEAEHATEAGMDEFLGKPVALERLNDALERWVPALRRAGATARPLTPWGGTPVVGDHPLEVAVLERLIGRDPAVVREFLREFRATAGRQAQEIRDAATHGDLTRVTFVAHKLKSTARSVGALPFGELCADLERVAKLGDGAGVFARLPRFDEQLDLLLGAVDAAVA
jgi:signal transduction histidine kinase/CheY-like chemotaxis protein/HPt (histidine-containing phosphotransfer) domain-containing protein